MPDWAVRTHPENSSAIGPADRAPPRWENPLQINCLECTLRIQWRALLCAKPLFANSCIQQLVPDIKIILLTSTGTISSFRATAAADSRCRRVSCRCEPRRKQMSREPEPTLKSIQKNKKDRTNKRKKEKWTGARKLQKTRSNKQI